MKRHYFSFYMKMLATGRIFSSFVVPAPGMGVSLGISFSLGIGNHYSGDLCGENAKKSLMVFI
ncbi:MAG: hypothetical protein GX874_08925 [Smithella sp.]|nr:hypothetical protein [Smithella sp.]